MPVNAIIQVQHYVSRAADLTPVAKPTTGSGAKLATALEQAYAAVQKNAAGLTRDERFRAPHQEAIASAAAKVAAASRHAGKQSAELTVALEAVRRYLKEFPDHLAGNGDPRVIAQVFTGFSSRPGLVTLLARAFVAAGMPTVTELMEPKGC
jgi:hypothetical protein